MGSLAMISNNDLLRRRFVGRSSLRPTRSKSDCTFKSLLFQEGKLSFLQKILEA